jgi:hypothetical protein
VSPQASSYTRITHPLGTRRTRLLLGYYYGAAGAQFGVMPLAFSVRDSPTHRSIGVRGERAAVLLNTRQKRKLRGV